MGEINRTRFLLAVAAVAAPVALVVYCARHVEQLGLALVLTVLGVLALMGACFVAGFLLGSELRPVGGVDHIRTAVDADAYVFTRVTPSGGLEPVQVSFPRKHDNHYSAEAVHVPGALRGVRLS